MKNKTKNKLVKTSSSLGTWIIYAIWIFSIVAVIDDRNALSLTVMGFMSLIAIVTIVENAKIQSRVDLFDGSEDLPTWEEFLERHDQNGGV